MTKPIISLNNVSKQYGQTLAVNQISLEIGKGQVYGFLGPNGAGKSTTINMLLDFIRPTKGSVMIFGLDARLESQKIHQKIGFLSSDMTMDEDLTGWQQLEFLGNLRGNFDKEYITELAKSLDCRLDKKFKTLSRGNKQKVGLIAALMHKPELLILDEPTTGLDPLIQAKFNQLILKHKQSGGTAFISSHMLSEIQEICDQAAFIRGGKIIATKSIKELTKTAPKYIELTTKQPELIKKLNNLAGFTAEASQRKSVRGSFDGNLNNLLKLVSSYELDDFTLRDTELESEFMKYYEDQDNV